MRRFLTLLVTLLVFGAGSALGQVKQVTGRVISAEDKQPIPGVNVFVKEAKSVGTTTNIDGEFKLVNIPANAKTIVISFVGYQAQELPISSQLNVVLSPDNKQIAEVVVTGIGAAMDKRKVAIGVDAVTSKNLLQGSSSVDNALVGKVAGAQIQSISGQPGQQANIILRGINSLSSTQPMILVDGVQINTTSNSNGGGGNLSSRLADIDMSNVERVEVVQGAAAATIYGAQGANGVIQIFTKKGKKGEKVSIRVNSRLSVDNVLTGEFKQASHHYFKTDSDGYILDQTGAKRIGQDPATGFWTLPDETITAATVNDKPYKEKTYDHLDQFFRNDVITQNYGINVSGGGEFTDYSLSLSNMDQQGSINGKYTKTNFTANIGAQLFKNFTVRSSTQLITSSNTAGGINGRNNIYSGMGSALTALPFVDLRFKDALGNYPFNYDESDNSVLPYYTRQFRSYNSDLYRVIQGFNLNYKLNKFVEFDYKFSYDHYRNDYKDFIKNQKSTSVGKGIDPTAGQVSYSLGQETYKNSLFSTFLKFDFEKDFGFSLPIQSTTQFAYDWRENEDHYIYPTGSGFGSIPPFILTTTSQQTASEESSKFITFGYLVNQRFDYGMFGGFSVGFRSDYSSEFGGGSSPFTFPRADAYLRLSEFLKYDPIYEMKLRFAYGEAGIQPNRYSRIITLKTDALSTGNTLYLKDVSTNPDLGVEKSKEFELGLDYGININKGSWLSKVSGSLAYWDRRSEGSIYTTEVSPSTGALGILNNAIDLKSNGIQFSLDIDVFKSKNVDWTFGTRFGTGVTKVDKISNGQPIVVGSGGQGQTLIKEGERVGAFFGVSPLTSIDQKNSNGERYILEANASKYEIVNGMVVNTATRQVQFTTEQSNIGDATPDFNMSFINNITLYQNFSASFQVDWSYGGQVYNQTRQWLYRDKIHPDFDKAVTIGGETKPFVAFYESLYNTNNTNSYFVEDASYVRLRDVSISYNFGNLLKSKYVKGVVLSITGKNLLTFTNYSGLDPEAVGTNLNNPLYRGIDLYTIPNTKAIQFGLNVEF